MDQIANTKVLNASDSESSNQLVTYKENPIRDICILTKNFDLSSMPSNYMRRRSKIEEVIYRAVFSQNNHKSPFSSFKIAKNCLEDIDKIDIVTGINNLKKVIKSTHSNSEQISIMVHKVADTYLLDEFDIDALFMRHHHYADWDWLRNFIRQESFQLSKPDLSRATLSMRDLYAKFLYHSVSQPSIEMPSSDVQNFSGDQSPSQISIFKQPIELKMQSQFTKNRRFDAKNEDFLNLVDWKLEDLSFVVGSDLSIFGTKSHPCISLRLSPCHEPINILTGIDMWLENMLNEVPEIAMCYHDQGIVMREYEILKTDDIPKLTKFNENEVKSIAKNLSHFLSTNATKEGHTYWLFKETDSTTVKLYDLTSIWEKEQKRTKNSNGDNFNDNNPFTIPVAILCYKMAEKRVNQWNRAREKRGTTKLTSSQFNKELLDNKLADNEYYFNEIFRLLKNCINLLMKTDKHRELVRKAQIMMCRLYLEVDQTTLNNLQYQQDTESSGITKLDLNDLKKDDIVFAQENMTIDNVYNVNDVTLMGSKLFDLCAKKNTQEIIEQAIQLTEMNQHHDNYERIVDNTLWSSQTLLRNYCNNNNSNNNQQLSNDSLSSLGDRHISVIDHLIDSVIIYYTRECLTKDFSTDNVDEIKSILKSGFMVALLDEEVLSNSVKLLREHDCYYSLIGSFLKYHVDLQGSDCITDPSSILTNVDKSILKYHYDKQEQFLNAIFVFKSVFMTEKRRMEINNSKIHQGWYQAILYLTSLAYKLSQFPLTKTKAQLIQRGMPIFLNFLVAAIVTMYHQMSIEEVASDIKEERLKEWCVNNVLPSIKWITEWNKLQDFNSNPDENLIALVWSNKAKLCRLAAALILDSDYNYAAIEAYTSAIDTLAKLYKKKPNQMAINIKCDRLDLCMLIVENAYSSKPNDDTSESITEMRRAVECAEKYHRIESHLQSIAIINLKLTSLRLRMNFVKYYLNLKAGHPLNYEQVLNDFKSDLNLILQREDALLRCKETSLILFYMFKILFDRCELMSISSIRQFLVNNCQILSNNFKIKDYFDFCEKDGKSVITGIYQNLVSILKVFVNKCKMESTRKKKRQTNVANVNQLEIFLSNCNNESMQNVPIFELLGNVLKETQNIL